MFSIEHSTTQVQENVKLHEMTASGFLTYHLAYEIVSQLHGVHIFGPSHRGERLHFTFRILQPLCSLSKVPPAAVDVPIPLFPQSPLPNCDKAHGTFTLHMCVYLPVFLMRWNSSRARILSSYAAIIRACHSTEQILRNHLLNTIVHKLKKNFNCLFFQT